MMMIMMVRYCAQMFGIGVIFDMNVESDGEVESGEVDTGEWRVESGESRIKQEVLRKRESRNEVGGKLHEARIYLLFIYFLFTFYLLFIFFSFLDIVKIS